MQGVSLQVARGEIVAVVGANGAGKSTLLKSIAGQVATEGTIEFEGQSLRRLPAHRITRLGVSMVPEGRRLFPRLSVEDNLRLGAYAKRGADQFKPLELVFSLFPRLQERLPQRAETLSGGEQQMLAIGRALMTQPRFLMLDEPSQGIMPRLVDDILAAVTRIRDLGVTVLLVEQRLVEALAIADRAYVLQTGRIVLSGPAAEIASDAAVRKAYLGIWAGGPGSCRRLRVMRVETIGLRTAAAHRLHTAPPRAALSLAYRLYQDATRASELVAFHDTPHRCLCRPPERRWKHAHFIAALFTEFSASLN